MVPTALYILVEELRDFGLVQLVLAFLGGEHAKRVTIEFWVRSGCLTYAQGADV